MAVIVDVVVAVIEPVIALVNGNDIVSVIDAVNEDETCSWSGR